MEESPWVSFWEWFVFVFLHSCLLFTLAFLGSGLVAIIIPKIIDKILDSYGVNPITRGFFQSMMTVFIIVIGLVFSFQVAGVDVIGFGLTIGAFSYIGGLALRDVLPNTVACAILWAMGEYKIGTVFEFTGENKLYAIGDYELQEIRLYAVEGRSLSLDKYVKISGSDFASKSKTIHSDMDFSSELNRNLHPAQV